MTLGQNAPAPGHKVSDGTLTRAAKSAGPPRAPPSFTVGDIRAAIPEHCFKRSALRGFAHIAMVRRCRGGWILRAAALPAAFAVFIYSKCCLALLAHPLQDFILITALGALAVWMYDTPLPLVVAVVAWPVYWFVQVGGVVMRKTPR